jgi:serine/threonine-protein kinase
MPKTELQILVNDDSRIAGLVEEILETECTPEEACRAYPELLPEVRKLLDQVRSVKAEVESVFPSKVESGVSFTAIVRSAAKTLPTIPGYEIEGIIGSGGMGVVYKARHIRLNRIVAIKMLLVGGYAGPRELERFKREAESIAALRHPNIVQIYDAGEHDGFPYFTMEFMAGGSLDQKLAGTPLSPNVAAEMAATLARAIQTAHDRGIVHRDLKPANVLLDVDSTLKITDFGLAGRLDATEGVAITLDGARLGTPSYMSPEQARGPASSPAAHCPAVDIYGLGAILYELLTGRPPFRGESPAETERQVISDEPVPPAKLNPRTPRDLQTICLKCLQKASRDRYGTALELAEDLDRFLTGRPIHARPVGPMERTWRWVRRNPTHAAAWGGGLAGLGAILGAALWMLSERAAINRAVSDDLAQVIRFEEASDFRAARNTLERAKTRLGAAGGRDRLAQRAAQIERELDLVDKLGEMRFGQRVSAEMVLDNNKWWGQYREAFTQAGLLTEGDTPEAFAARVARSPARTALVAAMDDMMICARNKTDLDWILRATSLADPDPWRDKARDPTTFNNLDALIAVAREAPVESQPATILLSVGGLLMRDGRPEEALSLLRRVQAAHPSDFWANFALAEVLAFRKDSEAIGFYHAAIAIRPDAAAAHVNLGLALDEIQNRTDEAIDSMSRAVTLDPRSVVAQYNLGMWLLHEHRTEEAIVHARIATQIDPGLTVAHRVLGRALAMAGQYCEAVESFRRALELEPDDPDLLAYLNKALKECEAVSNKPPAPHGP